MAVKENWPTRANQFSALNVTMHLKESANWHLEITDQENDGRYRCVSSVSCNEA